MSDQDPFSGLRTGPWVGANNDSLFKGLADENTVVPGGVIEDQSITNAKITNLNAEKIDAGTLSVTGSMKIQTTGTSPQLEVSSTGTIMRDNAGLTILEINGATTTLNADIINAGTINGSLVDVTNIDADNINAGALTLTPLSDGSGNAIVSTNFTVSSTGSVTAKDLTLVPTPSGAAPSQGIDAAAAAILIEPPTGIGAAVLHVTNSDGTGDFDTVDLNSATAAAANAISTITTDNTHSLKAGQLVSFHSVGTTWNDITADKPTQILGGVDAPTATTFKIKHYLALPAVTSNSAGTIRAYKRLSVRAAGGLYVWRDNLNAGDIAAGSLVLGNNLTNYGTGSIATVADGEIGFIKATTPRFGSGGNLYSSNGTTSVNTSGSFSAGTNITAGGIMTADAFVMTGAQRLESFNSSNMSIRNNADSAYNGIVLERVYPGGQTTAYLDHTGNFVLNDTLDITGSLTVSSNATVTGEIYAGGSIVDPSPLTTTATTNAAIWVIPAVGEPYGLRRNSSSARYKTNIVDADEAVLEAAKKVRPRHFESTIPDEAGATRLGFIAEEILAAGLSHAVGYDEEGRVETLDSVALIAALFTRVNDLEARLAALEGA